MEPVVKRILWIGRDVKVRWAKLRVICGLPLDGDADASWIPIRFVALGAWDIMAELVWTLLDLASGVRISLKITNCMESLMALDCQKMNTVELSENSNQKRR